MITLVGPHSILDKSSKKVLLMPAFWQHLAKHSLPHLLQENGMVGIGGGWSHGQPGHWTLGITSWFSNTLLFQVTWENKSICLCTVTDKFILSALLGNTQSPMYSALGHCPNSDYTPSPALNRALWGRARLGILGPIWENHHCGDKYVPQTIRAIV